MFIRSCALPSLTLLSPTRLPLCVEFDRAVHDDRMRDAKPSPRVGTGDQAGVVREPAKALRPVGDRPADGDAPQPAVAREPEANGRMGALEEAPANDLSSR